ncbi:subtype A tannase [Corynebacterium lowii]|nr:subtype A tannase [Corynebacterium lowii]MDP9850764.1 hypothetical protein [Corynebacterium lowii]
MKKSLLTIAGTLAIVGLGSVTLVACGTSQESSSAASTAAPASSSQNIDYSSLAIDNAAWKYDSDNDVYYQLGNEYVTQPEATDYETMGIFVPGAYLDAKDNGDGTYTASVKKDASVGDYKASTAPIVLPVNTPGYAAQKPPTEYSYDSIAEYMNAGMIYVWPGIRGKDSNTAEYTGNAPWGATDIKAAIRYLRYNDEALAGDKEQVFVFGHSGGGAQSAIVGASGDSELYEPYLNTIGAAMMDASGKELSDAVAGAMTWCPITSLDEANSAYEWNMGQFADTDTRAEGTWTKEYSNDLAAQFAQYINEMNLKGENGEELELKESDNGIYQAGSYYDAIVQVVEDSLNDFLKVTQFPYTPSNVTMAGMGTGIGQTGAAGQGGDSLPELPEGATPPAGMGGDSEEDSTTYNTVEEYIDSLNSDSEWVEYDSAKNTAKAL